MHQYDSTLQSPLLNAPFRPARDMHEPVLDVRRIGGAMLLANSGLNLLVQLVAPALMSTHIIGSATPILIASAIDAVLGAILVRGGENNVAWRWSQIRIVGGAILGSIGMASTGDYFGLAFVLLLGLAFGLVFFGSAGRKRVFAALGLFAVYGLVALIGLTAASSGHSVLGNTSEVLSGEVEGRAFAYTIDMPASGWREVEHDPEGIFVSVDRMFTDPLRDAAISVVVEPNEFGITAAQGISFIVDQVKASLTNPQASVAIAVPGATYDTLESSVSGVVDGADVTFSVFVINAGPQLVTLRCWGTTAAAARWEDECRDIVTSYRVTE